MANVAFILKDSGLALFVDGQSFNIEKSHLNYDKIIDKLKTKDYDNIVELIDIPLTVQKVSGDKVSIVNDQVVYQGKVLHNYVTTKLIQILKQGFDIDPLLKFIENLMQNPSNHSVEQLYRFLEHSNMPITDDGHFLAYKNVRGDFKDIHSGTFDNSVGQVVEMVRNEVNDNPNQTCSTGLHFCGFSYLKSFNVAGGVTIIVKINPRDVVSVPVDYNNAKGRACRYEVVGIHEGKSPSLVDAIDNSYQPEGFTIHDETADEAESVEKFYLSDEWDDSGCWNDSGCFY